MRTKESAAERAVLARTDLEQAITDAETAERKEALLQTLEEERRSVEGRLGAAERLGDGTWRTPLTNGQGTYFIDRKASEVVDQSRSRLRAIDVEIARVEAEGPPLNNEPAPLPQPTQPPAEAEPTDGWRRAGYVAALRSERDEVEARIARMQTRGEDPAARVEQLAAIDVELQRATSAP